MVWNFVKGLLEKWIGNFLEDLRENQMEEGVEEV